MSSGIDLYYLPGSAPCQVVLFVAKELNLDLNLKETNLMTGEHLTPEYLKINPTHTIPTIVDNNQGGFALWESKAIITYLINQYSPGHKLYPTDPKIRASIDKILYFDIGTLYPAQAPLVYPLLMGDGVVDPSKLQPYQDKLAFLNGFLSDSKYVAGTDHYTVADLCILASLGLGKAVNLDWSSHPNVIEWFDRMRGEVPYDDILENGITVIKNWAEAKQKKD